MLQICDGLNFMHKSNILHLDLKVLIHINFISLYFLITWKFISKPENILCLSRSGHRIKIIDFGLARKYDPNQALKVLFGTPEFVAPEVVNYDKIGYGTDMWSVGVICYVL